MTISPVFGPGKQNSAYGSTSAAALAPDRRTTMQVTM
jgi:hypothetical protein